MHIRIYFFGIIVICDKVSGHDPGPLTSTVLAMYKVAMYYEIICVFKYPSNLNQSHQDVLLGQVHNFSQGP